MRVHCSGNYGREELHWEDLVCMPGHGEPQAADSETTFSPSSYYDVSDAMI